MNKKIDEETKVKTKKPKGPSDWQALDKKYGIEQKEQRPSLFSKLAELFKPSKDTKETHKKLENDKGKVSSKVQVEEVKQESPKGRGRE